MPAKQRCMLTLPESMTTIWIVIYKSHPIGSSAVHSKVSKGAKIRNRYNQVPHVTQDTNGKVTNS